MTSVCFYFQVHQPYRIPTYTFFDIGMEHGYEDTEKNRAILNKVSEKCYLPANRKILDLIRQHNGKFRVSYSLSGTIIEQMEQYRPDVLQSFIDLANTGCVEFLAETYHHSLSYLYSKEEFERQINLHQKKIEQYFNQSPKVFRNTELIYNNEIAAYAEKMGYKGIICEGVDHLLGGGSPNFVYQPAATENIKCLLKNYKLSDDIAFRFSDKGWSEFPLTADKFSHWVHQVANNGEVINLFMDYETFGEHQWESTGIFNFLDHLPEAIMRHPDFDFKTPSEVIERYEPRGVYDAHHLTSWADSERDLSAWRSNAMQHEALEKIYALEKNVKSLNRADVLDQWSKLLTSDHFYYMCTKYWADGDVHKYFSPYESPYEAYIYFMNALSDLENTVNNLIQNKSKKANQLEKEVA